MERTKSTTWQNKETHKEVTDFSDHIREQGDTNLKILFEMI